MKCVEKNLQFLSNILVQKNFSMTVEYSTASENTIEKKFSSFLPISQKALDDAYKVLSKGNYPHAKNPEKFFDNSISASSLRIEITNI